MLEHVKKNKDNIKSNISKSVSNEFQLENFNAVLNIITKSFNDKNISEDSYKESLNNLILKAEESYITIVGYPSEYKFVPREELIDFGRKLQIGDIVKTKDGEGRIKEIRRHPFDKTYIQNVVVMFESGEEKPYNINDIIKE